MEAKDQRLARALLQLYPSNWRERYGDEFLALVAESGLTWRTGADIARAAVVERARRYAELARAEAVATDPLPPLRPWTDREFLLVRAGFLPLMVLTIVALNRLGIPYPDWMRWMQLLMHLGVQPLLHFDEEARITEATIGERIVLAFAWFLAALLVIAGAIVVGSGIRQLGAPEPPTSVFVAALAVPLAGLVRLLYRGISSALNKPRPEVTSREMTAWHVALFAALVVAGAAGRSEAVFWSMVIPTFMWLRFTRVRHVRAARRRQLREQRGF